FLQGPPAPGLETPVDLVLDLVQEIPEPARPQLRDMLPLKEGPDRDEELGGALDRLVVLSRQPRAERGEFRRIAEGVPGRLEQLQEERVEVEQVRGALDADRPAVASQSSDVAGGAVEPDHRAEVPEVAGHLDRHPDGKTMRIRRIRIRD